MRFPNALPVRIILPVVLVLGIAACDEDDEGLTVEETPTEAATVATADSTLETPTPEPTETEEPDIGNDDGVDNVVEPTPSAAYEIAIGPEYFLYVVAEGDTLELISEAFDGQVGGGGYLTPEEIAEVNDVEDADLEPGMVLAIPAVAVDPETILAENTIEEALGVGEDENGILLLQPTPELIEGYLGRVALYRVTLERSNGNEPGYVMEYWFTERPGFRAGVVDPDARYTSPAFTMAAGSLADYEDDDAVDVYDFERHDVPYRLVTYADAQHDAGITSSMFGTADDRE